MRLNASDRYHTVRNQWETDGEFRRKVVRTYIAVVIGGYVVFKIVANPKKAIYSYGIDSIWKVKATEKEVSGFNRVLDSFYKAQDALMNAGAPWDGKSKIKLYANRKDMKAYNKVADRMDKALKKINQDKTPIEILDDFLVKN